MRAIGVILAVLGAAALVYAADLDVPLPGALLVRLHLFPDRSTLLVAGGAALMFGVLLVIAAGQFGVGRAAHRVPPAGVAESAGEQAHRVPAAKGDAPIALSQSLACPHCAQPILAGAKACGVCGRELPSQGPAVA